MIVSAIRPPNSPARMDSIGNPGTGDGGGDVVVVVEAVAVELVVVTVVDVVVVLVGGTLSGPYLRIMPSSPTIQPSSEATMKTDLRATDIVGGTGNVATTFQVKPSQCTITLAGTTGSWPTAQPSWALTIWSELRKPPFVTGPGTFVHWSPSQWIIVACAPGSYPTAHPLVADSMKMSVSP